MSDDTRTPTTQAGRTLRDNPEFILIGSDPDDGHLYVKDSELTTAILAIEAQARNATGLREALDAHEPAGYGGPEGFLFERCICGWRGHDWADHREQAIRAALAAAPQEADR